MNIEVDSDEDDNSEIIGQNARIDVEQIEKDVARKSSMGSINKRFRPIKPEPKTPPRQREDGTFSPTPIIVKTTPVKAVNSTHLGMLVMMGGQVVEVEMNCQDDDDDEIQSYFINGKK